MNRRQRRQQPSQKPANAAKIEQNQEKEASLVEVDGLHVMKSIIKTCRKNFPGLDVTIFISSRPDPAKKDENPEFNYASSAPRAHVMAIIAAFVDAEFEKDQKTDQKPN